MKSFFWWKNYQRGFAARALGASTCTEGETMEELQANIRDAVKCHFDEGKARVMRRARPDEQAG
jgi:hypothetical protein